VIAAPVVTVAWAAAASTWVWRTRPARPAPLPVRSRVAPGRRRWGRWAPAAVMFALVGPVGALVTVAAVAGVTWLVDHAARRRAREHFDESLAVVLDLLAVCVSSGQTLGLALGVVADAIDGPVREWLARIDRRIDSGERLADALEAASAEVGGSLPAVVAAVVARERIGAPHAVALRQAAARHRQLLTQRRDERIRRLPVLLLLPLTLCVLPAVALVILVPTLIDGVVTLR
jgi:pilus assembly protein TadC